MHVAFQVIAVVLYCVVGMISLAMAYKSLSAQGFLPFHEHAAGRPWDELGEGTQAVVTALMRLTGLGFLLVGLQLVALPLVGVLTHEVSAVIGAAAVGLVFCLGLCLANYRLKLMTGAATPWQGALYAALVIAAATVLFFVTG